MNVKLEKFLYSSYEDDRYNTLVIVSVIVYSNEGHQYLSLNAHNIYAEYEEILIIFLLFLC